ICSISKNNENVPIAVLSDKNDIIIAEMNDSNIFEEQKIENSDTAIWSLCAGMGDYSFVTVFSDGLYGLKENQWLKICDFTENDFSSYNIFDMIMTAENEFAVVIKTDDNKFEMRLLTERDISEIKEKKIIKMAITLSSGSDIDDKTVKKFNSENDVYKIELVNYGNTGETPAEWAENLKKDIITGNSPDIVTFNSDMSIDTFGAKESIFVDFYSLLDNDNDFSRTDFIDGFLEGMESNGKLLMIDSGFTLKTLCIKNKFTNSFSQWNYEQFLEVYNNMPDDMILGADISYSTRTDVFMDLINYNSFIDYDNASCNFKSDNFIKAMKLISENEIGLTNAQADAMWDSPPMIYTEQAELYRTDKALISKCKINSFFSIKETMQGYFNEPATFIGYPSEAENGTFRTVNGGYSIMANSDNIEGAWEFLKYYLFSETDNTRSEFSGLEKNFIAQLEYEKTEHLEKDPETGEMMNMDGYWLGGDFNNIIDIEPLTDAEADKYDKFVRISVKNTIKPNNEVDKIIKEELDSYFNGERSAEETAGIIQNRVSIYISECYT
ncbi:MAG: extracellular solute-binding protein, partial [Ruminococcus sp.]|nr:extracellular solute-binding protein [Ruminococcus sp.]